MNKLFCSALLFFTIFQSIFSMEEYHDPGSLNEKLLNCEKKLRTITRKQKKHDEYIEKEEDRLVTEWDETESDDEQLKAHDAYADKTRTQLHKVKEQLNQKHTTCRARLAKLRNARSRHIITFSFDTISLHAPSIKSFMQSHSCLRLPEIQQSIVDFLGNSSYFKLYGTITYKPIFPCISVYPPIFNIDFSEDKNYLYVFVPYLIEFGRKIWIDYSRIQIKNDNQILRGCPLFCCVHSHGKVDTWVSCISKDGQFAAIADNSGYEEPHNFPRELKIKIYRRETVNVLAYILGSKS